MLLHPDLILALSAVLGIVAALTLIAAGAPWIRGRSLPLEEMKRLVDDLSRQQQAIEALLARLEAERPPVPPASRGTSLAATTRPTDRSPQAFRSDPAEVSAVAGPTLIAVPSLAANPSASHATREASAELSRRFGAIWKLADAGESADSIARTTGQPIGQVELILGLRRQRVGPPDRGVAPR